MFLEARKDNVAGVQISRGERSRAVPRCVKEENKVTDRLWQFSDGRKGR